jgi:hypothetical protein
VGRRIADLWWIAKFPSLGLILLSHPPQLRGYSFVRGDVSVVRSSAGQID